MESSAAGVAALALFVLWLGFWVPHRLRLRQQLLDSRVDDRFSTGLRVLAVADGPSTLRRAQDDAGSGQRGAAPGPVTGSTMLPGGSAPLLAPGPSSDDAGGERPMGHDEHRDASRGPGASRGAPPGEGGAADARPRPEQRASRLAQLELRAARARRRLLLTVLLLLATIAGWAVVATGLVDWYAGAVPSALLLVVLALGRLAARSARRADARWTAERRTAQREATQARALANGGPYAPRNRARVTGHAVRPSAAHTQMIPRVPAPSSARADQGFRVDVRAGTPVPIDVVTPAEARPARREPATAAVGDRAETDGGDVDRGPQPGAATTTTGRAPVGGEPWDPVPVPLPTYVTKPSAPRREPRPLPAVPSAGTGSAAASLAATMHEALGPTVTPARTAPEHPSDGGSSHAGDEPRPRTETLGLPLEQILARRRAAG
ncbi:hypothetical protein GCM10009809_28950 [Isoptericola hypogeus]|uniref:Uncharacterized protein n=1 Tax=Isoptericola hypogeus TaxID=300179 RepID=A0ABN2JP29_9MICO